MKTAYLILAHQQPRQVARLICALRSEGTCFFLHVDRKANLAAFKEAIPPSRQVCYVPDPERVKVLWGGFSPVQATLRLLHCAYHSADRFERYCLLSGADFPIKHNDRIREAFATEKEYISIEQALYAPATVPGAHSIDRYHFYDYELLNPRTSRFPALPRLAARFSRKVSRPRYQHIPLYQGSQWWALTGKMIGYIMNFIRKYPDYLSFHRFTLVPDEVFFHSIVKSSPWAANIHHDFEQGTFSGGTSPERGCHFVDWHSGDTVPKVLGPTDMERLLDSKALFARKFEGPGAEAMLDNLERLLANGGEPATRSLFLPKRGAGTLDLMAG